MLVCLVTIHQYADYSKADCFAELLEVSTLSINGLFWLNIALLILCKD